MRNILEQFLDQIEVCYTQRYANTLFNEHPYRYNMYGLKRMLDVYGVKTMGVNIPSKSLMELNYPNILHTRNDFAIGIDCDNKTITYLQHGKITQVAHDTFSRIWDGNALVVTETTDDAAEPNYGKNKREEVVERCKSYSIPFLLILAAICGIVSNASSLNLYTIASLILNVVGLCLCVLLMQKQIMGESLYGDKVCSLFHHADCNSILDDPNSKILGVSWSEVGFGYFIANILLISLYPASYSFVVSVNWFAMCFSLWSIYYQWLVAKSWCVLCVAVQTVITIMGVLSFISYINGDIKHSFISCLFASLTYAISIMAVHRYAVSENIVNERIQISQKYRALKVNSDVAKALITKGEYHETSLEDSNIVFGNPQAKMRITILSNPHCNPCARMHARVDNLLALYGDEICIQYILSSFNEELEDSNRYLISCYDEKDRSKSWKAFSEWYEHHKHHYRELIQKQSQDLYSDIVNNEMERHAKWRKRTGIVATPKILVNGYLLSKEYQIEDLPMIINPEY